jgi:hypothetical protein
MPAPPPSGPAFEYGVGQQVTLQSKPATTQLTFRQICGEIGQWNPTVPPMMLKRWVQTAYRSLIDERNWYGLLVKGLVTVPQNYSAGQVTVITGSPIVTGSGTMFTNAMIGRQFRIGFSQPIYTIQSVQGAGQFTLDLNWGGPTYTGIGYQIFQSIVSLGNNVKRVYQMVNQQQGYQLITNMTQAALNRFDTWRTQMGWTWLIASYAMSPDGSPLWELYPAPTFQQSFPYLAIIQPPDMQADDSYPVSFLRTDILVNLGVAKALLFGGKGNPYYNPETSQIFQNLATVEINKMKGMDNTQWQQDLQWDYNNWPMAQFGSQYEQSHDVGDGW